MIYFSNSKKIFLLIICVIGLFLAFPNFSKVNIPFFPNQTINLGLDLRGGVSVTLEIAVDQLVASLVGSNIKSSVKFKEVTARAKELKKEQPGSYIELFEQAYVEKMNGEPMAKWFLMLQNLLAEE